jgi:hypothetical protein
VITPEVLDDIRNLKRFTDLHPDMKELPSGFAISDAMAARMKLDHAQQTASAAPPSAAVSASPAVPAGGCVRPDAC